jgi:hypothetical protein
LQGYSVILYFFYFFLANRPKISDSVWHADGTTPEAPNQTTRQKEKTMTIINAIKKLEKAGFTVTERYPFFSATRADIATIISYVRNGRENTITSINVRRRGDESDVQHDYHAGVWCDNIAQAIQLATGCRG